jgi:hypothetical protein
MFTRKTTHCPEVLQEKTRPKKQCQKKLETAKPSGTREALFSM